MITKRKMNRALKAIALATVSFVAVGSATAQTTSPVVTPRYGNLSPFYGNLSPFYGNLSPFYGNLSPFYGNLSPFWGNLSPFYGNLSPFYGNLSPFTAATDPNVTAFYGTNNNPFWGSGDANPFSKNPNGNVAYNQIGAFWGTAGNNWTAVMNAWSGASTATDYQNVATLLQTTIVNPASSFWGKAVAAGITAPRTDGGGDNNGNGGTNTTAKMPFANWSAAALTKAGIGLNSDGSINASSLAALSPTQQATFFLNWYDGLMSYSGTGHVDWWMGATGWSPNLASIVGSVYKSDYPVVIGMIDFAVAPTGTGTQGALTQFGSTVFSNGHGAAVGSLIMGSVDGSNIMGILPAADAKVVVYNPYDATGTTNWTDVGKGIDALAANIYGDRKSGAPVGVINASLGVPGVALDAGWNTALASGSARGHNLVVAAGNEGVTQTTDVPWNFAINPNLILVGSVGLNGTISNFSNTPGEACLIDTATGVCDKLKNHFIVAPGELILVSDGNGGVSRQSGTSLAAPLVSGAIALLQARWPWLGYYPNETAQIILKSATPLGTNPGADPVYGVGELNIAASQAPLNWNSVAFNMVSKDNKKPVPVSVSQVVSQVQTGSQTTWNSSSLYFTGIETVGKTHRDFQIPMASSMVGQLVNTEAGQQQFQTYLSTSLRSWVAGGAHFASTATNFGALDRPVTSFTESSLPMGRVAGLDMRLKMSPVETTYGFRSNNLPLNTEMALMGGNQSLHFGYGDGAGALNTQSAFSERSDSQIDRGGANPILGLASGGAFADYRMAVGPQWAVSFGVTSRRSVRDVQVFGPMIQNTGASKYQAEAEHFGVDYAPTGAVTLHGAWTRLHEDSGLLGVQSLQTNALSSGSTTDGLTVGFDLGLSSTLMLSGSGTVAKTTTAGGQALTTSGLTSTAAELALTKSRLFFGGDRLRLTVSQPMRVQSGGVDYADYGVTDRETGALGIIHEHVGAAQPGTPIAVEMLYGKSIMGGAGEVGVFGRTQTQALDLQGRTTTASMAGAKVKFNF
jgi:hypothetical protein